MENYRLSSYTIFTKLEDTEDKYMLVHGYTGAIDIVTENVVFDLKSNANFLKSDECSFSTSTFNTLVKRGYITEKTIEEEFKHIGKMADLLHQSVKKLYKYFLFAVTYNCNFRCPYCYENEISNNGNNWGQKTFTKEMVDQAYAAMLKIEPQRKLHANVITLYGGEPLLAKNKEIVDYIVQKGHRLGYKFSAITNGYDLDHFKNLLSPDLINNLQITIDGDEEQHNKRRIHYQAKDTFRKVLSNVRIALDCGISVSIRVNTDMKNFETLYELQRIFDELGYSKNERFSFHSALLQNFEPLDFNADSNIDYPGQKQFNHRHKQEEFKFSCQDYGIFRNIYNTIKNKKLLDFKATLCASQYGEYIFDPYGDIYPCWDVIGKKQHSLGTYTHNQVIWTDALKQWHGRNIQKIRSCIRCKYALLCNGGCAGLVYFKKNKILSNYCNDFSDTFEVAINRVYKKYIS